MPNTDAQFLNEIADQIAALCQSIAERRAAAAKESLEDPLAAAHLIEYHLECAGARARWAAKARAKAAAR
jgi:hypothetical protein